ncbi:thioredoxin family protein [Desulfobacterales bacterium HSG17]|nr:thioredoxin family protein [Desulfobacterales bacterium HSG17]
MEIKVLGPGCAKCEKTAKIVKEVIKETSTDANVEKITDMMEIAGYKVFSTPAVVVNGEVKCSGKIPKKKEILSWLGKLKK